MAEARVEPSDRGGHSVWRGGHWLADCAYDRVAQEIAAALNSHADLQAQVAALTVERDEARAEAMQARASAAYWKTDSKRLEVETINLTRCLDEAKRERDEASRASAYWRDTAHAMQRARDEAAAKVPGNDRRDRRDHPPMIGREHA